MIPHDLVREYDMLVQPSIHSANKLARYHVTVLSNFIRGYGRYARRYDKSAIGESTYPDQFFLLGREELSIGVQKAGRLLEKLSLPGDELIVLETSVDPSELQPNLNTGLGAYVQRPWIKVNGVHGVDQDLKLTPQRIEEVAARSQMIAIGNLPPFNDLSPRSISILPIAQGCQAACPFCFSHASISDDQEQTPLDWGRVESVFRAAADRGAERAVITGGGEPGLLQVDRLHQIIALARRYFDKVVLITNGYRWGRLESNERCEALKALVDAGLTVLSVSRHHHNATRNTEIMHLDTQATVLAKTWSEHRSLFANLTFRWVCVLQQGGIQDEQGVHEYLAWAASTGVPQVCFKELYVSTSTESVYHNYASNDWSHAHQVPLSIVLDVMRDDGWRHSDALPWGAPLFDGYVDGQAMRVAAYTEPSLLWELEQVQCRSWNLMADGRCFASLESSESEVCLP